MWLQRGFAHLNPASVSTWSLVLSDMCLRVTCVPFRLDRSPRVEATTVAGTAKGRARRPAPGDFVNQKLRKSATPPA